MLLYAFEYIKEQCGLGNHMSYVLSIPLQPLEDMQSFSTSSPLRINKHSLILWNIFAFENPKLFQSPVRGWSGARRHLLILGVSAGESVWCGDERQSAPDLQVKTDRGPVKPTPGRVAILPAREVGYKYPPHTAVSSKSKHFRFYLVIYHCSLPHGGKLKEGEMLSSKTAVCTVFLFLFSTFHFVSSFCLLIFIERHLVSLQHHKVHSIKESSQKAIWACLQKCLRTTPDKIFRQIPHSTNGWCTVSFEFKCCS